MKFTVFGVFTFMLMMSVMVTSARAQETIGRGYSAIDYRSLLQTYLGFYNGGNPTDGMLDEYTEMVYCELYKAHYQDDFQWETIRRSIRNEFKQNQVNTNRLYEIVANIRIGRYNIKDKYFPLHEEEKLENVGKLSLYVTDRQFSYCGWSHKTPKHLPSGFFVLLSRPLSLDKIPVPEAKARRMLPLIHRSEETGERELYIRFRVELVSNSGTIRYRELDFSGELTAIDIFLDPDLSQKVYSVDLNQTL